MASENLESQRQPGLEAAPLFTADVIGRYTKESQQLMLGHLMAWAGRAMPPGELGQQIGDPKNDAVRQKVSQFLTKVSLDPDLGHRLERGGTSGSRYCGLRRISEEELSPTLMLATREARPRPEASPKPSQPRRPTATATRNRGTTSSATRSQAPVERKASAFGDEPIPREITLIKSNEERVQNVLSSWNLSVTERAGEQFLLFGTDCPAADPLAAGIVQTVAAVEGPVSITELQDTLREYSGETVGPKAVMEQLAAVGEFSQSHGITGWRDEWVTDESGRQRRFLSLAANVPEEDIAS